jgi:hypothetical protein
MTRLINHKMKPCKLITGFLIAAMINTEKRNYYFNVESKFFMVSIRIISTVWETLRC